MGINLTIVFQGLNKPKPKLNRVLTIAIAIGCCNSSYNPQMISEFVINWIDLFLIAVGASYVLVFIKVNLMVLYLATITAAAARVVNEVIEVWWVIWFKGKSK